MLVNTAGVSGGSATTVEMDLAALTALRMAAVTVASSSPEAPAGHRGASSSLALLRAASGSPSASGS